MRNYRALTPHPLLVMVASLAQSMLSGTGYVNIRTDVGMFLFIVCSRNTTRENPPWALIRDCVGKLHFLRLAGIPYNVN